MVGEAKRTAAVPAAAAGSTGGSLISDAKLRQLYATMIQCRLLTERAHLLHNDCRFPGSAMLDGPGSDCYRMRHRSAA